MDNTTIKPIEVLQKIDKKRPTKVGDEWDRPTYCQRRGQAL